MHSLRARYKNHVRRHANVFEIWDKVIKISMCARITVCCLGVNLRIRTHAQSAKCLDGRM
jgi:hypothetical protein